MLWRSTNLAPAVRFTAANYVCLGAVSDTHIWLRLNLS